MLRTEGVYLMQTLFQLHLESNLCHLDVTPSNIMLQAHCDDPWDSVRLIDFGFAACFNPGKHQYPDSVVVLCFNNVQAILLSVKHRFMNLHCR